MNFITKKEIEDTVSCLFGDSLDACNVFLIKPIGAIGSNRIEFCITNNIDRPIFIKSLGINIEGGRREHVLLHPFFLNKDLSQIKDIIAENSEIRFLSESGKITVSETISRPVIYDKNYDISYLEWTNGDIKETKKYESIGADQVAILAMSFYFSFGKEYRCISCIKLSEIKDYFFEKFPEEINVFREKNLTGFENFKNLFLREFDISIKMIESRLSLRKSIEEKND